ncbi:MAG: integrase/recombinase XerC [Thermoleophilaceae bacterium]|nr:integrase/recombinase XerC [Thermoleophilaceae bacterium]
MKRVASRAGIKGNVHPHTLRHAFADHILRASDIRTAQALLGHATVGTTEAYLSAPALDDLVAAVAGATFNIERPFSPLAGAGANPVEAPTGFEPVYTALQAAA